MSGVGPIGWSGDPLIGTNYNTTPNSNVSFKDSLESIANGHQVFQSLLSFMNLVGAKSNELQETVNLSNQAKATSRIDYYQALIQAALGPVAQISLLITYSNQARTFYTNDENYINALNAGLADYNANVSNDQAAVDAMNNAITLYTNNSIDEATYNIAVGNYNAYVADQNARVSSANAAINIFNSQVTFDINPSIDSFNAANLSNIPPVTHESGYSNLTGLPTIPTSPPPPTETISYTETSLTASSAITPTETDLGDAIDTQISILAFVQFFYSFTTNFKSLRQKSNFAFYQIFNLAGKAPNLPASFTEPANKTKVSESSPGGAGSSVPLAISVGTLSSPAIAAVLSHALFMTELQASMLNKIGPSSDNQLLGVNLNASELLSHMGLFSVNTAVRLLGGKGGIASIDPRSSIVATALGVGLVNELATIISAGVVKDAILGILRQQHPNISEEKLQKLAAGAIASTELVLLLAGTLSLAAALNSPRLVGQLLSTISNEGIIGLLSSAAPFSNFLNTPSIQQNLAASLAKNAQLSDAVARDIIRTAISQGATSTEALQLNITNALIAHQGTSANEALNQASIVVDELRSELISGNLLNRIINRDAINGTTLNTPGVLAILDRHQGSLTVRELRHELVSELQKSGLSKHEAKVAAHALVSSLDTTFERLGSGDLKSLLQAQVNLYALRDNIDSSRANAVAGELTETLLGGAVDAQSKSIAELLSDRIGIIKSYNDAKVNANLEQVFKEYTTPDLVKFGLANLLGDPGKSLLYLASGLIYTPDQSPSKPGSVGSQRPGGIDMPV